MKWDKETKAEEFKYTIDLTVTEAFDALKAVQAWGSDSESAKRQIQQSLGLDSSLVGELYNKLYFKGESHGALLEWLYSEYSQMS